MMTFNHTISVSTLDLPSINTEIFKVIQESLPYYIPNFVSASLDDGSLKIQSGQQVDETKAKPQIVELIRRVASTFRDSDEIIYDQFDCGQTILSDDPFLELESSRQIVSTGRGKFIYSGDFEAMITALDVKIQSLGLDMGGHEERYPTTVNTSTLLDAGYLASFPHHAFFVTPVNLDAQSIERIKEGRSLYQLDRRATVQDLGFPHEVNSPTVCYHCFEGRRGQMLLRGIVTALNKCHRYEPVNVRSLERLTTYWMREIIIFDDINGVQSALNRVSDWTAELLREMGISFKIVSANDPFFADSSLEKRLYQSAFELKKEVKVPIFGGKWISVGSFNNHQTSIVKKLKITGKDGYEIASGCAGWGIERLLYGIISHHGTRILEWPTFARKALGI